MPLEPGPDHRKDCQEQDGTDARDDDQTDHVAQQERPDGTETGPEVLEEEEKHEQQPRHPQRHRRERNVPCGENDEDIGHDAEKRMADGIDERNHARRRQHDARRDGGFPLLRLPDRHEHPTQQEEAGRDGDPQELGYLHLEHRGEDLRDEKRREERHKPRQKKQDFPPSARILGNLDDPRGIDALPRQFAGPDLVVFGHDGAHGFTELRRLFLPGYVFGTLSLLAGTSGRPPARGRAAVIIKVHGFRQDLRLEH